MPTKGHHKIQPVTFLRSGLKIKILLFFFYIQQKLICRAAFVIFRQIWSLCANQANTLKSSAISVIVARYRSHTYQNKELVKQGTFSGGNACYSGNTCENLRTYRFTN